MPSRKRSFLGVAVSLAAILAATLVLVVVRAYSVSGSSAVARLPSQQELVRLLGAERSGSNSAYGVPNGAPKKIGNGFI